MVMYNLFVIFNLLLSFCSLSISLNRLYRTNYLGRSSSLFLNGQEDNQLFAKSGSCKVIGETITNANVLSPTSTSIPIRLINLSTHRIPYLTAWEYQKRLLQHHIYQQTINSVDTGSSQCAGSLLVLQHSPVYTLGTGTQDDSGPFYNLIEDEQGHRTVNYETVTVERAGQATYHGPGQLVLYPILDLSYFAKDINFYLRSLEQIVINTCHDFNITHVGRVEGQTGVWINDTIKIAAMGIKLRRWVTMHGVSVNVNPNLKHFANIVPCGIVDKAVGSLEQFAPHVTLDLVYERLLYHFTQVFHAEFVSEVVDKDAVEYLSNLPASSSL